MSERWPILLTHHPREESARCTHLGPVPVCRRCLATWPLAAGVLLAGVLGHLPPAADWELALWLGPPVGEYVAVHRHKLPYRPGRTWLFGAMLGVGLGRAFHRYVLDPADLGVWLVLASVAVPTLAAALLHQRDSHRAHQRSVKKSAEV